MRTVQFTCDRCKHETTEPRTIYKDFKVQVGLRNKKYAKRDKELNAFTDIPQELCLDCVISCHEWYVSGK